VLVTFTENIDTSSETKKRKFGFNKGSVVYMAPDFNEPLDDLKDYM
jgi:hypothetical protein